MDERRATGLALSGPAHLLVRGIALGTPLSALVWYALYCVWALAFALDPQLFG